MRSLLVAFVALIGLTLGANAQCASGYTQLSNVFACQSNATAIISLSPATADNGWQGFAFRQTIPIANLTSPGFTIGQVRVKFIFASSTSAGTIDAAYISTGAATTSKSFDGNQVRLTFSGNNNVTGITGAQTITSDYVPFSFNFGTAPSIVVSAHFGGTTVNSLHAANTGSNQWNSSQATGTEGSTTPSGTWGVVSDVVGPVTAIEVTP